MVNYYCYCLASEIFETEGNTTATSVAQSEFGPVVRVTSLNGTYWSAQFCVRYMNRPESIVFFSFGHTFCKQISLRFRNLLTFDLISHFSGISP